MSLKLQHIQAKPALIEKFGYQITYEWGSSRRIVHTPKLKQEGEVPPHGAGSFHDPSHHFKLLDRVEHMLASK
jgi:hypothetical protein